MARVSFVDVALRLRGAKRFSSQVAAATAQLEGMGVKGATAMGNFAAKAKTLKWAGRELTTRLTLPIVAVGAASVYAATKWESAFTGVEKTVDATAPQLQRLNDELLAMSMQIPVSAQEIAGIAEAAGQLGIGTENIASFTRVMADLGVATNMTSTDAAEQLARLANITQMPQSEFDRLGSTVVALGNSLAATESDIVQMGLRIAGAGNQVGLTEAQILSFAGALSSVGIRAEMGGTAISTAFLEANSAVLAGGASLEKWADIAGMSAGKFRKQWNANAGLAMTEFLEGIKRLSDQGVDVKSVLDDLGLSGVRMRDVLLRASGAGDLLREALGLGNKAWRENNALQKEADKRYATAESRFQMLKNTLFALGVVLGDALLPPLLDIADVIGGALLAATKWFRKQSDGLKKALVGLAIAAALLGPILFALGVIASGVGAAMVILTSPIGLIILAVIGVIAVVGVLTALLGDWRLALLVLTGPAGILAVVIIKNWDRIKKATASVVNNVRSRFQQMINFFKGVPRALAAAISLIVAGWRTLRSGATSVVNFVKSSFQSMVNFFKGLPAKIRAAAVGMWDGLKDSFRTAIDFIIEKWNALKDAMRDAPGGGAIGIPGIPIPGLATGGTVTQPGMAMVGERGPELLSLPRGASVIPLSQSVARSAGGPQRIEVPVYLNGRQIALAVADEVSNARARA